MKIEGCGSLPARSRETGRRITEEALLSTLRCVLTLPYPAVPGLIRPYLALSGRLRCNPALSGPIRPYSDFVRPYPALPCRPPACPPGQPASRRTEHPPCNPLAASRIVCCSGP
jgi:hypothetical protein